MEGSETPSTVRGGERGSGYGDVFNRREVEEVQRARRRDRERDRRDHDRDRDWDRERYDYGRGSRRW